MAGKNASTQVFKIPQGHELRIEIKENKQLSATLLDGNAEVFGTEIARGQKVTFQGQNVAVYTWEGCRLQLSGEGASLDEVADAIYEADETPMVSYLNTHDVLEQRRQAAKANGGAGPRTIVVGPTDSGKSTLCKILLNYAVRMAHSPTFVELDIGQGSITCPGSIGATPVEAPIDIEEGMPVDVPVVYYYGHATPSDNPELYKFMVDRLAHLLERRAQTSREVDAAGMVINTMGWVTELGYELLLHSIQAFKADVVLVVGQERLYSQLNSHFKRSVEVVKLAKSGGVVTRTPQYRKGSRTGRVREYFYGPKRDLQPHSTVLRAEELKLFRVGGGPRAPASALPIGATAVADPLRVAPVALGNDLLHTLLAVSHASAPEQLLSVNVAGFLYVTDVDVPRGTLTVLAPCPGPLPGKLILVGAIKVWFE